MCCEREYLTNFCFLWLEQGPANKQAEAKNSLFFLMLIRDCSKDDSIFILSVLLLKMFFFNRVIVKDSQSCGSSFNKCQTHTLPEGETHQLCDSTGSSLKPRVHWTAAFVNVAFPENSIRSNFVRS